MEEHHWDSLVDSIAARECTPFLGAGVSIPPLKSGSQLAAELANEYDYPLNDIWNLPRVTQYIATSRGDAIFPKRKVAERIRVGEQNPPDFTDPKDPHRILADLGLPVYVTTNYDGFMTRALEARSRQVDRELCRWNREVEKRMPQYKSVNPTEQNPVVFHLHGHTEMYASMVLTEDDYIEFIVAAAQDLQRVLPARIQEALTWSSLLFVGYSLNDWNFRVLLRSLMKQMYGGPATKRLSVSVQLPPDTDLRTPERRVDAEEFLCDYLGTSRVQVHWGNSRDFLTMLQEKSGLVSSAR